ncbi:hypothetical protein WN865_00005 [Tetragenococcus halophilus]
MRNLSYFNHMSDNKGTKETCEKCRKEFAWEVYSDNYPGGKDTEFIDCPYCGARNASVKTSGSVITSKI